MPEFTDFNNTNVIIITSSQRQSVTSRIHKTIGVITLYNMFASSFICRSEITRITRACATINARVRAKTNLRIVFKFKFIEFLKILIFKKREFYTRTRLNGQKRMIFGYYTYLPKIIAVITKYMKNNHENSSEQY